MRSNLDSMFKMDEGLEKDGVWLEIADGVRFKVRRFGGSNPELKKAHAKYFKPVAHLSDKGLLPQEKEQEIFVKAFVHSCMIEWTGVEFDGEIKEYTPELAISLFTKLPDLFETIIEYARSRETFKEDVGND